MPTQTTILSFKIFRKEFPFMEWLVDEPVLCYPFIDLHWANRAADKARRLIISKKLPLTARADWRWFGKSYRPVLMVELVPEEFNVLEEVPDNEGMDGGWWNGMEERE